MDRDKIIKICQAKVLPTAAKLYGSQAEAFKLVPGYEGATNIVYEYQKDGQPMILRVSYIPERTLEHIQAELDFIYYLAQNGVRVSVPVPSAEGRLVETVMAEGVPFHIVSFVKGKGMRVPDNGYRYRTDAPIEEYFQNWGQVLGQMHRLSKSYYPRGPKIVRPEWFDLRRERFGMEYLAADDFQLVRRRIQATIDEIKALPKTPDAYGLMHSDFNDGNFTVDYSNGDITVFDFDDACYFWFVHELAAAWEGGIGRTMFDGLEKRKAFMDHYMEQVMEGYSRENYLPDEWLARLPLFIDLIVADEFLHYARYIGEADDELQAEIAYKIKCIEEQIPYFGFFDSIYSPDKPFSL